MILQNRNGMDDILNSIIKNTHDFLSSVPKDKRKEYGQFFTNLNIAKFMADLFCISVDKHNVRVLDPGSGSGILSCSFLARLENESSIESIELVCYETDLDIIPVLERNLSIMKRQMTKKLKYCIVCNNYITSQTFHADMQSGSYDFVISNPPYLKIRNDSLEAVSMAEVCYGTPNLYALFMAMACYNVKENGELVFIVPRSWTSGLYFKKMRYYLLLHGFITNIHLFKDRDGAFKQDKVLQELVIIKYTKGNEKEDYIHITTSDSNFDDFKIFPAPYDECIQGISKEGNNYVYIITNKAELDTFVKINSFKSTISKNELKISTGIVVNFRNKEMIGKADNAVPMFGQQHISKNGLIQFPVGRGDEYISDSKHSLLLLNQNYLFLKRFTTKEENRRLQGSIYLKTNFGMYDKISTQNKINYIYSKSGELTEEDVYGLYVIFNSKSYDTYYRILNGSTQVNASEVNEIPIPCMDIIRKMGNKLMTSNDFSEDNCEYILNCVFRM